MLLVTNIGELVLYPRGPLVGAAMRDVQRVADAAVLIDGARIVACGRRVDVERPAGCEELDAGGGCVVPGLIDCHTHTVFAGSRAAEFVQRIEGRSYVEIAEAGGGIRSTMRAVRAASEDELVEVALPRLGRMLVAGTTTAEVKSGYGLTVVDELKMLRAVRRLGALQPVELVGTYLAAHTVPPEFVGRADAYLDEVLADEVLATIAGEGLAEFCDVFVERGAFGVEQGRRVLMTAARHGLRPRVHADQITQMGASRLAGEVGAVSADHLETIDAAGLAALRAAGTVAVLLPACSLFLGVEQADARRVIDAGVPVAVATDLNPGTAMVESLALTLSIACTQMRMTPVEALVAATANAAAVLGRAERVGAIAVGMQADLLVLAVKRVEEWLYEVGRNCVARVVKSGWVVV